MMTAKTLAKYKAMALKRANRKSGAIVLDLLAEINALGLKLRRSLLARRQLLPINDEDPWPYHTPASAPTSVDHAGTPIKDVPDDYLVWWLMQRNRTALKVDAELALVAQLDLQLYDHINKRIKRKSESGEGFIRTTPEPEPQIETPIPETAVIEPEPEPELIDGILRI
jgi:hypothetical protein